MFFILWNLVLIIVVFFMREIYTWYVEGILLIEDNVEVIKKVLRFENCILLRVFFGVINYYGKFIYNLSLIFRLFNLFF